MAETEAYPLYNMLGMTNQGARPKTSNFYFPSRQKNSSTCDKDFEDNVDFLKCHNSHEELKNRTCQNDISREGYVADQVKLRDCCSESSDIEEDYVRPASGAKPNRQNCHSSHNQNYGDVNHRYNTFPEDWPYEERISVVDLAKYGWIHTGKGDEVMCFHCRGKKRGWVIGQTALGEHKRLYPNCEFIRSVLTDIFSSSNTSTTAKVNARRAKRARKVNSAAMQSAQDLGYAEDTVNKAVTRLKQKSKAVTADNLLDELFRTEGLPNINESQQDCSSSSSNSNSISPSSSLTNRSNSSPCHRQQTSRQHTTPSPRQQKDESQNGEASFHHRDTPSSVTQTNSSTATSSAINQERTSKFNDLIQTDSVVEQSTAATGIRDISKMLDASEQWKSRVTCKVCLDAEVGVLFLPCRHLICCNNCASSVSRCPLCRAQIVATIKAYL